MTKQHNNQEYKYKFVLYHLNHKEFAQWKITSQKAFDQAVKWVVSVVMRYTNAEGIPYTDFKRLEVDLRANLTVDFTNVRFSFLPITAEES